MDIKPPRHGWLSLPCDHPADKADSGRQLSSLGSGEAKLPIPPPQSKPRPSAGGGEGSREEESVLPSSSLHLEMKEGGSIDFKD